MDEQPLGRIKVMEDQFAEKIADNMHTYGVSTTVGRVLGIIYMNRKPMTLDELSEATGMSKTRMSQVVREMVDLNIAEKVLQKGVRKDLYNVEQDYYQTFISLFTSNWRKAINKNKMFEKKLSAELKEITSNEPIDEELEAKINLLLKETKEWLDYYQWLANLVEFFESGEIFKHVPKP
ncbi:GbsR/MarR family transcriptional regulator [Mesobacillus maritimus]|uniref:GbsR/MarR family transcriptional regulator n=1 Tax=Mesobacillus maritimus TaxID=1643336 RepID=UPI00203A7D66|nr:GbsR/MarR family transcriptional regulator [Mesobacillus maritimus]MCM3587461.1 GbsR/MarR family transcriptional regulator [Mesobacillus maritimus]MCM3671108.1 GbsR/MarR family transcriptional regulator [Mesobacillus maritimus]